jgi:hypothetical protein
VVPARRAGELNLREPADAKKVEKWLSAVDVNTLADAIAATNAKPAKKGKGGKRAPGAAARAGAGYQSAVVSQFEIPAPRAALAPNSARG